MMEVEDEMVGDMMINPKEMAKKIAAERESDMLREITMEAEMEYEIEWDIMMGAGTRSEIFERELNNFDQM